MSKFKPTGRKRKYIREEKPEKIFKQMTRDHVDVLQNIEFCLVSAWRNDGSIDDKAVAYALKKVIEDAESPNESKSPLISSLKNARLLRLDVPDDIWRNGLKVVLESVHTHSDAKEGDRDYLEFVSEFMP
jgi:hypothetical protein